jgi:hypothetical protein
MTTAYELALRALRSSTATATATAIANADGTLNIIPLEILSDSVDLKKMWTVASFPVAILFRETTDNWYGLFPAAIDFSVWHIVVMSGNDHDILHAQTLATHAIRNNFNVPTAIVQHLITGVRLSSYSLPHREPEHTEALSD